MNGQIQEMIQSFKMTLGQRLQNISLEEFNLKIAEGFHLKLWKEVSHADIRTFDEDVQKAFIDALNQVRGLKELSETTKISGKS